MGFLLGAFGKLAAGQRYRSIQAKLMKIQSRLRRASRDVANMEKLIDRQEKSMLNSLSAQQNAAYNMVSNQYMSSRGIAELLNKGNLNQEEQASLSAFQTQMAQIKAQQETQAAVSKQQIQDYFEQVREEQLEPLKDEEDLLQSEKDSLETQLKIAEADYKACQDMEKNDVQMLKPNYTAGGQ